MAQPLTCDCRCHWTDVADLRAAAQHNETVGVPPNLAPPARTDPVAATLACQRCRPKHAVAFLNHGTWWREPSADDWQDPEPPSGPQPS